MDKNIDAQDQQNIVLEGGTYEILQNRLSQNSKSLSEALKQLNDKRKSVYGSIERTLLLTDRISTDNNCVPADMIPIDSTFIFGYNVHLGLKVNIALEDVFSIYEYEEKSFHKKDLNIISDKAFLEDFKKLYKYYKNTHFTKFTIVGIHLYMVFRIGKDPKDVKTFKWEIGKNSLTYVDNRSDHELVDPDQHEFRWIKTTRADHRDGKHPHISINDTVFVETVGGDLTIKVEDNTDDGHGIYSEDVIHKDQSLDDGEVYYTILGNIIIIKIRPYQEDFRYIVYNKKIQEARRIDKIRESCILLPDDHGIIFSNGYYLQTGEFKQFENNLSDMLFEKKISSPNGEDFVYVFYNRTSGIYLLLSYNLIQQKAENPMICHGFSLFENGEMCLFSADEEAKKHHAVQVWATPFTGPDFEVPHTSDSFISKLGNKEIVRAMAECNELITLINKKDSYSGLYTDLIKQTTDILDSYHWLSHEETNGIADHVTAIHTSSASAVDEYEKVVKIKQNTEKELSQKRDSVKKLIGEIKKSSFSQISEYVDALSGLRVARGELISLKELRYLDIAKVEQLEQQVEDFNERLSKDCVGFLLQERALQPYDQKVKELEKVIERTEKVIDANEHEENLNKIAEELKMLIEIVSNLKIADPTETTRIIDNISGIYSNFNQIKAALKRKRKRLQSIEGTAEFGAQLKLIDQSVINYLDICDLPEKCEEYLTSVMVQLEELEGKFSAFDEFITKIISKREEVYNAFETKKIELQELRNRRTSSLQQAGERIIKAVENRISRFDTTNEINGYFAGDLMIEKLRDIIDELLSLGDTIKSDDLQSKLKTQREDAIRQLKDKNELYADGKDLINFGPHQFTVNTQPLEITIVPRDEDMFFHMTGTNFFEKIEDEAFLSTKRVWNQTVISENKDVYRAEYLAFHVLAAAKKPTGIRDFEVKNIHELYLLGEQALKKYVQEFATINYSGGYVKGIHDHDAALILNEILRILQTADLIAYDTDARALGKLFWKSGLEAKEKALLDQQIKGAGYIIQVFPGTTQFESLKAELAQKITEFVSETTLFHQHLVVASAEYLFNEISRGDTFVIDTIAADIYLKFLKSVKKMKSHKSLTDSLAALKEHPINAFRLAKNWASAYIETLDNSESKKYINEIAALVLFDDYKQEQVINISTAAKLDKMVGSHPMIADGTYTFDYSTFSKKLNHFTADLVPCFQQFAKLKKSLGKEMEETLRLSSFKPRVLSSFVRNRLINEVYLPLIGANLAKQIGAAGEGKRTDLMGLLLLISPPGYGKTTLMEYIANRLGVVFMKINGPAIGHSVIALDPLEAPNAAAREELEKLNLAFEMGDNVMIYLDDIQHCNPEFLQKFISLCDAQRKIEGVYKNKSKTYDFRGKKVSVVMAGNPYTESGDKFSIPDMLSNRADIYNLGDILGDTEEAFKLSYLENCFTSNNILARAAGKSHIDVLIMIKAVETNNKDNMDFEASHTAEELNEYFLIIEKLLKVRDVILMMNNQYIASAAQSDSYRTEPPFKLQGSYRDMNKIAEKVVPIMNETELQTLLDSHYESESQTLTTNAESNLLKYKLLTNSASEEDFKRWEEIITIFQKNQRMLGLGQNNQLGQAVIQMEAIAETLQEMKQEMEETNKKKTKYKLLKVKDNK